MSLTNFWRVYLTFSKPSGCHSSMVSSAPTILWPLVRIPRTPSTLFQFVIDLWCEKEENKQKRGRDWPIFKENCGRCPFPESQCPSDKNRTWFFEKIESVSPMSDPDFGNLRKINRGRIWIIKNTSATHVIDVLVKVEFVNSLRLNQCINVPLHAAL